MGFAMNRLVMNKKVILVLIIFTGLLSPLTPFAKGMSEISNQKMAKIQDINRNPGNWIGKRVTLTGAVVNATVDTFVLDGRGIFNDRILVIDQSRMGSNEKENSNLGSVEVAAAVVTNSLLSVTGVVKRLKISEIRQIYFVRPAPTVLSEITTSMPVLLVNFSDLSDSVKK